jgi:hypothetical protein
MILQVKEPTMLEKNYYQEEGDTRGSLSSAVKLDIYVSRNGFMDKCVQKWIL